MAAVEASGAVSYFHTDRLGSVVAVSNAAGSASETYAFSPYGESANPVTGNPWRYTGRYLDAETGLYYYRARYYSERFGQFLQTDPIGSKDDPNLYMYVGLDPGNATDPSGKNKRISENKQKNEIQVIVFPQKSKTHVRDRHSPNSPTGPNVGKFTTSLSDQQMEAQMIAATQDAMQNNSVVPDGGDTIYEGYPAGRGLGSVLTNVGTQGEDIVRVVTTPLASIKDPQMQAEAMNELADPTTQAAIAGIQAGRAARGEQSLPVNVEVVKTMYPIKTLNKKAP